MKTRELTFKTALAMLLIGATGMAACVQENFTVVYTVMASTGALLLTVLACTNKTRE